MITIDPLIHPEIWHGRVAEIQGAEGAYSFSELILQKIWMRREFDASAARTIDGRLLTVQYPGQWNRGAGPDFRGARLRIGSSALAGDIEVHLNAPDWDAHRHAADHEYNRVVLHVVLFPPTPGYKTMGFDGREIPLLCLLSLLPRDIESFALDDAAEHLAGRPTVRLFDSLSSLPHDFILQSLKEHALRRWQEKIHFARFRIERLGWEDACHHAALECLGYSGNRAPMIKVAGRWPLCEWASGRVNSEMAWSFVQDRVRIRCGRPANHPMRRLKQYSSWTRAVPDWPEHLVLLGSSIPMLSVDSAPREIRRSSGFVRLRESIASVILGSQVGGSRLDTLICDAFLPLLAVRGFEGLSGLWYHWFVGDAPDSIHAALRDAHLANSQSFCRCNGLAQGLLAWWTAEIMRQQVPEKATSSQVMVQ